MGNVVGRRRRGRRASSASSSPSHWDTVSRARKRSRRVGTTTTFASSTATCRDALIAYEAGAYASAVATPPLYDQATERRGRGYVNCSDQSRTGSPAPDSQAASGDLEPWFYPSLGEAEAFSFLAGKPAGAFMVWPDEPVFGVGPLGETPGYNLGVRLATGLIVAPIARVNGASHGYRLRLAGASEQPCLPSLAALVAHYSRDQHGVDFVLSAEPPVFAPQASGGLLEATTTPLPWSTEAAMPPPAMDAFSYYGAADVGVDQLGLAPAGGGHAHLGAAGPAPTLSRTPSFRTIEDVAAFKALTLRNHDREAAAPTSAPSRTLIRTEGWVRGGSPDSLSNEPFGFFPPPPRRGSGGSAGSGGSGGDADPFGLHRRVDEAAEVGVIEVDRDTAVGTPSTAAGSSPNSAFASGHGSVSTRCTPLLIDGGSPAFSFRAMPPPSISSWPPTKLASAAGASEPGSNDDTTGVVVVAGEEAAHEAEEMGLLAVDVGIFGDKAASPEPLPPPRLAEVYGQLAAGDSGSEAESDMYGRSVVESAPSGGSPKALKALEKRGYGQFASGDNGVSAAPQGLYAEAALDARLDSSRSSALRHGLDAVAAPAGARVEGIYASSDEENLPRADAPVSQELYVAMPSLLPSQAASRRASRRRSRVRAPKARSTERLIVPRDSNHSNFADAEDAPSDDERAEGASPSPPPQPEPTYEDPQQLEADDWVDEDSNDVYAWARGSDPSAAAAEPPETPSWLHGPTMSRAYAEHVLTKLGARDGLFLVRERLDDPAFPFCLSVTNGGQCDHQLVRRLAGGGYRLQQGDFLPSVRGAPTLRTMVEHVAFVTSYARLNTAVSIPRRSRAEEGSMPGYFHRNASRSDAVRRLSSASMADGRFLVRPSSQDVPGGRCYALSVVHDGMVHHHLITDRAGRWFINDAHIEECDSLAGVIELLHFPRADFEPALQSYVRQPPPFRRLHLPRLPPNARPPLGWDDVGSDTEDDLLDDDDGEHDEYLPSRRNTGESTYEDPTSIFCQPGEVLDSGSEQLVHEQPGLPPVLRHSDPASLHGGEP